MFKNLKYFEPNDGAESGEAPEKKVESTTSLDAVKLVADKIAEAISANRAAPAAVADPTANLAAEAAQMTEKYDALCADGKYAEAAAMKDTFMAKANAAQQGDPSANPLVKTAVGLGKKHAKLDHPEIMKDYGPEVEAYVNAMPIGDRIQPDAWERAVSRVKTDHIDDIIKKASDAAVKTAEATYVGAGTQGGSRGRKSDGTSGLDEMQMIAAQTCGISHEAYAKRVKEEEAYFKIPANQRGSYEGVPVVSNTIVPGKF